jgi:hypothetical protein
MSLRRAPQKYRRGDHEREFRRERAKNGAEAGRLEQHIARLRDEARQLEEKGAGRQSDDQAAVLAHVLGLETVTVEHGLMFFLAVLVEVGAALGLYFATGHMRPREATDPQPGRGMTVIEGVMVKDVTPAKVKRASPRQIATAAPRRVPRLGRA